MNIRDRVKTSSGLSPSHYQAISSSGIHLLRAGALGLLSSFLVPYLPWITHTQTGFIDLTATVILQSD